MALLALQLALQLLLAAAAAALYSELYYNNQALRFASYFLLFCIISIVLVILEHIYLICVIYLTRM
ncbi:hypothetical protein PACTADRAFT_75692 [Pachysolen tannophilus NRRL Y-2460]|uniref:Uncharacterized protein n=1 Tax=Pachysolen tannophilus NRRL Y-2460 TaxID=669874 RepID=A0A1E4TTV7_PACTA|nr:hypothetical protein PACTADRAFT_75692 [Pachysolen tannophilus NRRL Y-2460]